MNLKPKEKCEEKGCLDCQQKYQMPHSYCCLDECGEHEFCRNCHEGIYLKIRGEGV